MFSYLLVIEFKKKMFLHTFHSFIKHLVERLTFNGLCYEIIISFITLYAATYGLIPLYKKANLFFLIITGIPY